MPFRRKCRCGRGEEKKRDWGRGGREGENGGYTAIDARRRVVHDVHGLFAQGNLSSLRELHARTEAPSAGRLPRNFRLQLGGGADANGEGGQQAAATQQGMPLSAKRTLTAKGSPPAAAAATNPVSPRPAGKAPPPPPPSRSVGSRQQRPPLPQKKKS